MKSIIIILLVLAPVLTWADQPPCWCDFSIQSANKHFVAHIKGVKNSTKTNPPYGQWEIFVYKKENKDSTLLWKSHYLYDGYTDGILSNDGQTFAYVNYWYQNQAPVIQLYQNGKHTGSIAGTAFNIPSPKLTTTVSHKLWLSRDGQSYEFTEDDQKKYLLKINTIDGKTHLIDCFKGEIKN
ncbi:hypothetical protein [Adhaeribacter radiodurans]|uniref:Uncharacterized protein n=1 Tax=Adhaeribacter radiodurans TaxID=2745197 RepID=A0A7L7L7D9_9BACT|nr:hypothetical protein [Adhaeribacter radiodurans]QMU28718.1 hypothetical protein HUW48_12020 [Adhaeribacter radiodurans]